MKMLSKVKNYFKNNYENNVKPFFKSGKGKVALIWSIISAGLYTLTVLSMNLDPQSVEPQASQSFMDILNMVFAVIFLFGGILSSSLLFKKLVFSEKHKKSMLALSILLLSLNLLDVKNYFLVYTHFVVILAAFSMFIDSVFSIVEQYLPLNNKYEEQSKVIEQDTKLKKSVIQEDEEVESELGLTNYFKKNMK